MEFLVLSPEDQKKPVSEEASDSPHQQLSRYVLSTRCFWESPKEFGQVVSKCSLRYYVICRTKTLVRRLPCRRSKEGGSGKNPTS